MKFRFVPIFAAVTLAWGTSAKAQNLIELYDAAKSYDAVFQSAKKLFDANFSKANQSYSGLLPTANLGLTQSRTAFTLTPDFVGTYTDPITNLSSKTYTQDRFFGTRTTTLSATQPLYRPANLETFNQSRLQIEQSAAQLEAAAQDLLVRVSQAYFDVLASQDNFTFIKAQKTAVFEQLASAKRNFEVGTATITDTREAQARYDLVIAQEISAENDLRVKKIALDQLVGRMGTNPKPLNASINLPKLQQNELDDWVSKSEVSHPSVMQAKFSLDIAKLEIKKAIALHKPTIDLQLSSTAQINYDGGATNAYNNKTLAQAAAVVMNLPIFAGMSTQNRIRETVSLEEKAQSDFESSKRTVAQATRTAFFGVLSGVGQVKAFEAAENSSQVALDANKLGYSVGVRINIDVLNSQSQLFETKAKLAKARYDVLVGDLKLRQASGTLKAEDLQTINQLLAP